MRGGGFYPADFLQHLRISCEEIGLLKGRLRHLREGALERETAEAAEKAASLGLVAAAKKRETITPGKLRQDGRAAEDLVVTPAEAVRRCVLEALDLMIAQLEERFSTPGLKLATEREEALLKSLDPEKSTPIKCDELHLPSSVLTEEKLRCETSVLSQSFDSRPSSPAEMLEQLKSIDAATRKMFPEMIKLTSLVLSLPSSVAAAERSFSMLRNLKSFLRNRMGQARLTNLALMNMYGDKLTPTVLQQLARRFVGVTPKRTKVFGRF